MDREPGGLQFLGLQRVSHSQVTHTRLQFRVCLRPCFSSLLFDFPQKDAHEVTVHPREASPWTESTPSSLPVSLWPFHAVKDLCTWKKTPLNAVGFYGAISL